MKKGEAKNAWIDDLSRVPQELAELREYLDSLKLALLELLPALQSVYSEKRKLLQSDPERMRRSQDLEAKIKALRDGLTKIQGKGRAGYYAGRR